MIAELLPPDCRKRGAWLVAGGMVSALLDFMGVAALLSVLLLLLGDEAWRSYVWLAAGAGVLFMVAKNLLAVWLERRRSRYLLGLYRYFSARLLDAYYGRGLLFIRRSGAATLTYEVNYVCYSFVLQWLAPLLRMAGEAVVLVLLLGGLFYYSPVLTGWLVVCFLPVSWGYMRLMRGSLLRCGEEENAAKRRQWQRVQELFRGYAEVETNRAYRGMRARFETGLDEISGCRERIESLQRMPAALTEVGMALALLLVLVGVEKENLEVTLGVFGVAVFRMLPGIRALLGGWMQVRNAHFTVGVLAAALAGEESSESGKRTTEDEKSMSEREDERSVSEGKDIVSKTGFRSTKDKKGVPEDKSGITEDENFTFRREIRADHLTFTYRQGEEAVIRDFSFRICRGERIGIQGVSGVGKSTLFNLLLGFFPPTAGEIRIDGMRLTPANCGAWQRMVGYVPQEVFIMDGTIAENIALGEEPGKADRARILSVLRQVSLTEWVQSLPDGTESLLGENGCRMSGGQKQRIGLARALYKGAEVLFLDEATSALDNRTEKEVTGILRELSRSQRGLTLLMIAHRESSLRICDRIITMEEAGAEPGENSPAGENIYNEAHLINTPHRK